MITTIPSGFYDAVDREKSMRKLINEAWAARGLPPRSQRGESGSDEVWALELLLLSEPTVVGPWAEAQGGCKQRLVGERVIAATCLRLWGPRTPLTEGQPDANECAWWWCAAGRWGFAGTEEMAQRIADSVLDISGWVPHPEIGHSPPVVGSV